MTELTHMASPQVMETLSRDAQNATEKIATEIRTVTPETLRLFETARQVVPDGFTRARFFWPTPLYMDHGVGSHIFDVDGREYVDCLMGFGAMLLGHCHPVVQEAAARSSEAGTSAPPCVKRASLLRRSSNTCPRPTR